MKNALTTIAPFLQHTDKPNNSSLVQITKSHFSGIHSELFDLRVKNIGNNSISDIFEFSRRMSSRTLEIEKQILLLIKDIERAKNNHLEHTPLPLE